MNASNQLKVRRTIDPPPSRPLSSDPRPEPESVWDDEVRWALIAENAYYRAERRGFLPGAELDDWLAAEQEVAKTGPRSSQ
jgi:hypothetical protein